MQCTRSDTVRLPWDLEGQLSGPGATDQATPGRNAYPLADLTAGLQITAELALPRAGWAGVVMEAFTRSLLVGQGGLSCACRTGHTKPPPIGFGRRILRSRTIDNLVFAVKPSLKILDSNTAQSLVPLAFDGSGQIMTRSCATPTLYSLDQLRSAHTFLQLDPAVAMTASFLAFSTTSLMLNCRNHRERSAEMSARLLLPFGAWPDLDRSM